MLKYKQGYRYQTQEQMGVGISFRCPTFRLTGGWASADLQVLVIQPWYAWDGASFVLFKWFGTPMPWLVPSVVHDALYQAIRDGVLGRQYRNDVDRFFYDLLRARGVSWLVATVAYYCVRIGGNFAVRKTNPIREAV